MDGWKTKASEGRQALKRWRGSRSRRLMAWTSVALGVFFLLAPARGQEEANLPMSLDIGETLAESSGFGGLSGGPEQWTSREGLSSTIQVMLLLTVLSMAPAILLMTTSFVRIIVVLSLLRQAIGTQQLPPSQVITSMALFMTLLIMSPVWKQVYDESIQPYSDGLITLDQAAQRGVLPIRAFMILQIDRCGNQDDVLLFVDYLPEGQRPEGEEFGYEDVPLTALLPAYMLSELKTAFLIGFQIYLPFLIVDMVIASVMVSMGMLMLPPVLISLPFKLLLFVLLDGWRLVVGMLLESFTVYT